MGEMHFEEGRHWTYVGIIDKPRQIKWVGIITYYHRRHVVKFHNDINEIEFTRKMIMQLFKKLKQMDLDKESQDEERR